MSETPGPAEVEALVGVDQVAADRFVGRPEHRGGAGGLFGGQTIAFTVRAAGGTVEPAFVPYSVYADLLRPGDSGEPLELVVERTRDGSSIVHRRVQGVQAGKLIVEAIVVACRQVDTIDWQRDDAHAPIVDVVGPGPSPTAGDVSRFGHGVFDVRHVGEPETIHPLWVRSLVALPDDPWLHASIVAFWSDFGPNWATRAVVGRFEQRPTLSLNHALWFHRVARTEDWHLFDVRPRSVVGRQGLTMASLLSPEGALVASVAQGVFVGGA
jgi:acyl-CoA thioesterase-2